MNKAFEKILERLDELIEKSYYSATEGNRNAGIKNSAYHKVKKIVQEVAEEYNNGWIACSGRLPEEYDSIFAKLKGTDKWKDAMFEKTSDVVNVTVVDGYGNRITTIAHLVDGKWNCDLLRINKSYQIIAWQPLPEPYKERD